MRMVIQRVARAAVRIEGKDHAAIGKGLLVLVGVHRGDAVEKAEAVAAKLLKMRIFEDTSGKSTLSVCGIQGEILVVSQFTLAADLERGNRPSFDTAEEPQKAALWIQRFVEVLKASNLTVREGVFGASMQVELVNDGPVTYIL
jgi:D-tyrosyl-tRNA(Tyr) deacylase